MNNLLRQLFTQIPALWYHPGNILQRLAACSLFKIPMSFTPSISFLFLSEYASPMSSPAFNMGNISAYTKEKRWKSRTYVKYLDLISLNQPIICYCLFAFLPTRTSKNPCLWIPSNKHTNYTRDMNPHRLKDNNEWLSIWL